MSPDTTVEASATPGADAPQADRLPLADRPSRGEGREALIDAAIAVLTESGIRGVTYRSVAERAGVTHGLVRYHFHTLGELIRTAVHDWAATSIGLTDIEPGTGRIRDIGQQLPENLRTHGDEHIAMYEVTFTAVRAGDMRAEVRETYQSYCDAVGRELERAGLDTHDGILANLVFAAIDGLTIQQLVFDDTPRLQAGIDLLHQLLERLTPTPGESPR